MSINLNNTKPAAPAGSTNVAWQVDGSGNVSASLANNFNAAAIQQESYIYAADTGSANAYAVALSPAPTLVAGSAVVFKATSANTGASTLAVNGGSAIAIKKQGGAALTGGEIAAGQIIAVVYDGTNFQLIGAGGSSGGGSGSGAMVLLEEHTASSSGSLAFTSWYSSSYDQYQIELINLVPTATSGNTLTLTVSTNGGTSYSNSGYAWSNHFNGAENDDSHQQSSSASSIQIDLTNTANGTGAPGLCCTIKMFSPGSSTVFKAFTFFGMHWDTNNGGMPYTFNGAGVWQTTTAINALSIQYASGNITSGTVRVYGLTH